MSGGGQEHGSAAGLAASSLLVTSVGSFGEGALALGEGAEPLVRAQGQWLEAGVAARASGAGGITAQSWSPLQTRDSRC